MPYMFIWFSVLPIKKPIVKPPPPPPPVASNQEFPPPPSPQQLHRLIEPSNNKVIINVKHSNNNNNNNSNNVVDPRLSSDFGALIAKKAAEKRAKFQETKPSVNAVTFQPDGSKIYSTSNNNLSIDQKHMQHQQQQIKSNQFIKIAANSYVKKSAAIVVNNNKSITSTNSLQNNGKQV